MSFDRLRMLSKPWAALMVGAGVAADRGRRRHGAEDDGRCPQPGEHASRPRNGRDGRNSVGEPVLRLRQNRGLARGGGYPQQDWQKSELRSEHVGRRFVLKISRNRRSSNPTLRSDLLTSESHREGSNPHASIGDACGLGTFLCASCKGRAAR